MAWLGEIGLEVMLRDPIIRLVMRRDGVKPREVRAAMARLKRARRARPAGAGASSRA